MENLSDLDLQTLLQNFKDLSTDEQHNLINYLKKLEVQEPERVERLRQFVNLDPTTRVKEGEREMNPTEDKPNPSERKHSPFSNRHGSVNPMSDDLVKIESDEEDMGDEKELDKEKPEEKEKVPNKVHLDSEDEDYTFEDVVKAVSKNVKDKELEDNMKIVEESMRLDSNKAKNEVDLNDAKALISNLMSNFSKTNSNSTSIDLLGLGTSTSTSTMSADFAKTLSSINVASLTSIVNNVKKMTPEEPKERPLKFEPPSPLRNNSGKLIFDPPLLKRPISPRLMDRKDSMGFDDVRRTVGLGRQGLGGFEMGGLSRGPSLVSHPSTVGSLRQQSGYGAPGGLSRDIRGSIVPPRDLSMPGPSLGLRDRPMQYPRGVGAGGVSYGSNFGRSNDFPPLDPVQYPQRPNPFDQRSRMDPNPRFGGPFNNRQGGGNYRW